MHVASVVRLTADIATACLWFAIHQAGTAVSRRGALETSRAAVLARGTAVLDAAAIGKHPLAELGAGVTRLLLSKTETNQNRAREPSEDELQCARSRHGCGKSTANLIIKFRHVSP